MAGFVKEGRSDTSGYRNFTVAQMERIRPIQPYYPRCSLPYNLLNRKIESEISAVLREKTNIGVLAYSPMASGLPHRCD